MFNQAICGRSRPLWEMDVALEIDSAPGECGISHRAQLNVLNPLSMLSMLNELNELIPLSKLTGVWTAPAVSARVLRKVF